jgi:hypothetical protein
MLIGNPRYGRWSTLGLGTEDRSQGPLPKPRGVYRNLTRGRSESHYRHDAVSGMPTRAIKERMRGFWNSLFFWRSLLATDGISYV